MMQKETSSFRDPSGFVYYTENQIYRQINQSYHSQYKHLMDSGLYDVLISKHMLVEHQEVDSGEPCGSDAYLVISPQKIPFISYPYEWCFSQLKDAALLTLNIMRHSLDYEMILKDASAYNVQFVFGQPVFIDSLSFDFYQEGSPWVAYGQFCRHFLAPLFLMVYQDVRLVQLMRVHIDGIPLDLASKLLKNKGGMAAKLHIHMHAKASEKHGQDGKAKDLKQVRIKKSGLVAMIESLILIIEGLQLPKIETEWADYYERTNYSKRSKKDKRDIVLGYIRQVDAGVFWDLGANDGTFSRLALQDGQNQVIAFDIDFAAVEYNYKHVKKGKENMLPLLLDLTNPSPAIGFANIERKNLSERQNPDCVLALALIHHLVIANNIPFSMLGEWLHGLCKHLIIEFVPKNDSQVQTLLATRMDIFPKYTQSEFENEFGKYFSIIAHNKICDSERSIYLMQRKANSYGG